MKKSMILSRKFVKNDFVESQRNKGNWKTNEQNQLKFKKNVSLPGFTLMDNLDKSSNFDGNFEIKVFEFFKLVCIKSPSNGLFTDQVEFLKMFDFAVSTNIRIVVQITLLFEFQLILFAL